MGDLELSFGYGFGASLGRICKYLDDLHDLANLCDLIGNDHFLMGMAAIDLCYVIWNKHVNVVRQNFVGKVFKEFSSRIF
jgi:hypothetical protein